MDQPGGLFSQGQYDPTQEQGLVGILQQIQQQNAQPLVPNNPLAQLGSILSAGASGILGRPDPVMANFAADRQYRMQNMVQQAGILHQIQQQRLQNEQLLQQQRAQDRLASVEERQAKKDRMEAMSKMLNPFLESSDPVARKFASTGLVALLKENGVDVPEDVAKAGISKPLKLDERNDILKKLLSGTPPDVVATATGHDLSTVTMLASIPDSPALRKSLGMKTDDELKRDAAAARVKDLDEARKLQALENPEVNQTAHSIAMQKFGKNYFDLDLNEKKVVLRAAQDFAIDQAYGKGFAAAQARNNAEMGQPLGEKAAFWLNKSTFEPAPGNATEREVLASNQYVAVKDPQIRKSLGNIMRIGKMLEQVQELYDNRPDLYPKSTGSMAQDAVALAQSEVKLRTMSRLDPDLQTLAAAMGNIPTLARASGEVGNLSEYEQKVQRIASGLEGAATKEVKDRSIEELRGYLNTALQAQGFNPLPPIKRRVRVKGEDGRIISVPAEAIR